MLTTSLLRWRSCKVPVLPGVGGGRACLRVGESGASPRGEPAIRAGGPMAESDPTRDGRAADRGKGTFIQGSDHQMSRTGLLR